jgi:hypothetical protein
MKKLVTLTLTAAAIASIASAAGCATRPAERRHQVSYAAISGNLTPELQTLHERPVDVHRNMAVNQNQSWRMFWNDLGRVWYTDHPSRLSSFPVVSTSGNPR